MKRLTVDMTNRPGTSMFPQKQGVSIEDFRKYIKSLESTIKEYVKQRVKANNNKIKQISLKNKEKKENQKNNNNEINEDGYPSLIEINMTENEEKYFFT